MIVIALPPDLAPIATATFAHRDEDVRLAAPEALRAATFDGVDILVVASDPAVLTASVVAACDRAGARIVPYATSAAGERLARSFGLAPLLMLEADAIMAHPVPRERQPVAGGVLVVWGPHGSPGRSSVAINLATHLAGTGASVALIDADSHAAALAVMLGLTDDAPGFAAACRSADRNALDAAELSRISQQLVLSRGVCQVLTGINRPSRWPELSSDRVAASLAIARGWADFIVVDVAASVEEDEEIMSDVDAPRRNAATLAALQAADHIVAVAAADAVGVSRFIRAHAHVRELIARTPIHVVVNRVRSSALGLDAKGQMRRTLSRFAGIDDVIFIANEPEAADAALLHAKPIIELAPKSGFASAMRRLAAAVAPALAPAGTVASDAARVPRGRPRARQKKIATRGAELTSDLAPTSN